MHVLKKDIVRNVFEKGPIGLFYLFLNKSFITENILSWTNNKMSDIAKKLISQNEILAVVGLDLAMFTCQ